MKVNIEVSARHVHLSKEDAYILFGKDLTFKRSLSQPNQFLSNERVIVVGKKGKLENVAVLGPYRKESQVELSLTDCFKLGIPGVIRESGDLKDTPACKLLGINGEITLKQGVIVAKRHIHMDEEQSKLLNVKNAAIAKVKISSQERAVILDDVVIRVSKDFSLAMHVDTDEANAFNFIPGIKGEIIL